jgi:hypothetical protein
MSIHSSVRHLAAHDWAGYFAGHSHSFCKSAYVSMRHDCAHGNTNHSTPRATSRTNTEVSMRDSHQFPKSGHLVQLLSVSSTLCECTANANSTHYRLRKSRPLRVAHSVLSKPHHGLPNYGAIFTLAIHKRRAESRELRALIGSTSSTSLSSKNAHAAVHQRLPCFCSQ